MGKYFGKYFFKSLLFLAIGIFIFGILQYIFMPKRFPYEKKYEAGKINYYLGEEKNTLDVLICGTSHPARGILPMEMYESYGIKSYNLATSAQPLEATYYILREAIKTQKPKVVIWDISNLYLDDIDSSYWKMVMDEMLIGENKKLLATEYMVNFNNEEEDESLVDLLFPLIQYHARWKELTEQDFNLIRSNKHYFGKGGQIASVIYGGISVGDMNSMADELMRNTTKDMYEYSGEEFRVFHEEDILHHGDVVGSDMEWVLKIKQLCDANDIQLLAVKVPSVYAPASYSSAWTIEKYNRTRMLCEEYGIVYYDLLYDADISFDQEKDSRDAGKHLNLYGAQKVSANLGNYLKEHYDLSEERNEQWDKDLMSYQKVRKVALLELEQDFASYINMLASEYHDKMIFMAASDEMTYGLNDTDKDALRALGLRTDFSGAYRNSYIAVIDDGAVKYEALSNRDLDYSGTCNKSKKNYNLHSDGYWTGSKASIELDENEYGVGGRGLHIVVYDDDRGLVLDSVVFDTYKEYHTPFRNSDMINQLEEEFECYIMEVEDR